MTVVLALLIDQIFDNLVTPRIIAQTLRVHPAAVLVAAIIAANLLGLLGVVVAAPILATVALFWRYMMRKMQGIDPWPADETSPLPQYSPSLMKRLRSLWRDRRKPKR
jgi:predicted PurR-regulated permease PerM